MNSHDGAHHKQYVDAYEATGVQKVIGAPRVVEGKHKNGSPMQLTLSVSVQPDGTYMAILYRRTEIEARLKAEQEVAQHEAELLHMKLECLQLKLSLTGVTGISHSSHGYESPSVVVRPGVLKVAWRKETYPNTLPTPESKGICIAAFLHEGKLHGQRFKNGELGNDMQIKPGSHAFVKANGREPFLRLNLLSCEFGHACGHPQLACEEPILFAGEVEIDASSRLLRWNNLSGTYQCSDAMAFQTGLPLDKFWAVTSSPDSLPCECEQIHLTFDTTLYKVLSTSELEFQAARHRWGTCIQNLLAEDALALEQHQRYQHALEEWCLAVTKYGYKSAVDHK